MKVGIMSDSHDNVPRIKQAMELFREEGVGYIIHAGDLVAPFAVKAMSSTPAPIFAVYGNNDGERVGIQAAFQGIGQITPQVGIVACDSVKFAVMHEPYNLRHELITRKLVQVAVYGHTHEKAMYNQNGILIINPGESGGWVSGHATVAVFDTTAMQAKFIDLPKL